MNQTTPTPTVQEMPTDLNRVFGHLVTDHPGRGWETVPPGPEMVQAHRFAHGLDGRPDLIDADLTHVHGAPEQPQVHYHYGAAQRRTNGLAIASLVLGITWVWWIGSVLAVIFGIIAHHQIRESNGTQTGGGMATAGIVLGWAGILAFVGFIVLMVAGAALSTPTSY